MTSSVWSMVEGAGPATDMSNVVSGSDRVALFHSQLASALSTMGDAQYWEESTSPTQIRSSFESQFYSYIAARNEMVVGIYNVFGSIR